ncbi:uncharacterized protein LOC125497729 [Beta vulgaris subsp. vulgaris]|uniref:uncharacterized protein LOC125497729 n=1 Tax=Beta vulgaris subsp. vulgaris TaxID=3555 RepID=UPI002548E809|nr:uncharacterized protein LOC125497729 [Beta vulgaris subsp. vulgaris]
MARAQRFIQATNICRYSDEGTKKRKDEGGHMGQPKHQRTGGRGDRLTDNGNDPRFNKNRKEIYFDIRNKNWLPRPAPIRTSSSRRDKSLWCDYHKECGHTTKDCRELKKSLDGLADQGKLNHYLKHSAEEKGKQKVGQSNSGDTEGFIGVIAGGFASGGLTGRARKAHLRNLKHQVLDVQLPRPSCPVMTFGEPSRTLHTPHDDPLVIELKVANTRVKRVLVDSRSSADIITLECLRKLQYTERDVTPLNQPLIGFGVNSLAVSDYALSAVLIAEREGKQHPVYFISHAYRGAEAKYSDVEKMVFALVMARRKLKPYFQEHPIKVLTGQPLRKIIESRNHSSRMTDWADQLADFGLEFEPRRAIKAQALADFITECATRPPVGSQEEWELLVDGSSTKNGCGVGLVIIPPVGDKIEYAVKFEFLGSNNEAEYEALILGIQLCILAGATSIVAKSDSQLIVGQVSGEYEAKEDNMRMYLAKARAVIGRLSGFRITHIPRSENHQADALARMASSAEGSAPRTITWEVLREPSINAKEQLVLNRSGWMNEIVEYLRDGTLPNDPKEADRVKHKSGWFLWHDGQLYKKSFTLPLLKCVTPEEGNYVLREIHQGACGSHQGGKTIAGKALRAGYYWPTLKADASDLARRCPSCQIHSDIPRAATTPLTTIQAVLPFDKWGMDLLGPFPPASGQRKFLIVAIDYFTKWTEAEPLASITDKQVQLFIWRNIITRFGIPRALVSDNGDNSTAGRPEIIRPVRHSNKGIKKSLDAAKGAWVDDLPGVLWSARTTVKEATGHSPFGLVYGSEAVLPVEVGIPSPRMTFYEFDKNEEEKPINLDLCLKLEAMRYCKPSGTSRRSQGILTGSEAQADSLGDWVVRKVEATGLSHLKGKLGEIGMALKGSEVLKPGTFRLESPEGVPWLDLGT